MTLNFDRNQIRQLVDHPQIVQILNQFFASPVTVHSFKANNQGTRNQVYFISTNKGEFVLHILNTTNNSGLPRDATDLAFSFALQTVAYSAGVPVPKRFRTRTAADFLVWETTNHSYYLTLHERIKGRSYQILNAQKLTALGQMFATLHTATSRLVLEIPPTRNWSVQSFLKKDTWGGIKPLAITPENKLLQPFLVEFEEKLKVARNFVDEKSVHFSRQPVHGDICGPNLLFEADKLTALLDFDNCRQDYFFEDLSVPMLNHMAFADVKITRKVAWYFLDSYSRYKPLSSLGVLMVLHSWLAFHSWYACTKIGNEEIEVAKRFKQAQTDLHKARAIEALIKTGF